MRRLERVRAALDTFAARITLMGEVGAGQNTKAVNQVLVAGIAQAVCEGLALGEALGLSADKLLPTIGAGAAANWFLDKRGATMLRSEFSRHPASSSVCCTRISGSCANLRSRPASTTTSSTCRWRTMRR